MGTKYDKNALPGSIAQGSANSAIANNSKYEFGGDAQKSAFVRIVILDVISDPQIIDDIKLAYWEHELNVTNIPYAAVAPRNSVIARIAMGNNNAASDRSMVFYPFFPPHISLPCKPGEHVWAMFEIPNAQISEIGYWMCRIVDPGFVEDVNYTHSNRQFDPSFSPSTKDLYKGTDDPKYEFPNGVVVVADGDRSLAGNSATLIGKEEAYEKLLTDSDASKLIEYEPIPRYRKRPGDVVFEGSNNTLIVLGTDRKDVIAEYEDDPTKGKQPKIPESDLKGNSGLIDLVAGRGQSDDTAGKKAKSKLTSGADFKEELGKSKKELVPNEGNTDLKKDRSRVFISQRTKVDTNFGINKYNEQFKSGANGTITDSSNGDGAIVIKTDKIRLIARKDMQIIVMGSSTTNDKGLEDELTESKWASITLKTNGDIVLAPATEGVLKLGGDDADKAVLCTTLNNKGSGGTVTAQAIIDTMAGAQGAAGGLNGTFATKVLLK